MHRRWSASCAGILPIALALWAGAESRVSMGIAVIGGLSLGSALLYVIPAVYVLMAPSVKRDTAASQGVLGVPSLASEPMS
jgi:Cu/Ag efflux pump CusA